ncbi:hypothetical protein HDU85_003332 [Gaertneriomyces sp. JEL0708]|nr:hypothetical protein HDU85_003332 [Gaertneriomyces sp. JEL0708]
MTAAISNTAASADKEKPKIDAFEVGWLFVQEYYTFLNRNPERLHCFYSKKSYFLHGHEGDASVRTCQGQKEIHDRIVELDFHDCKVLISNVDSQASFNGGIVVQVLGEMSNNDGSSHKFAQTFFLAEQPNGYYVLNDIFRFLKEDIDNEYEESEDPTGGVEPQDMFSPETHAPVHFQDATPKSPEPDSTAQTRKNTEKARSPSPAKIAREEPATPAQVPADAPAPEVVPAVERHKSPERERISRSPEPPAATAEPKSPWGAVSKPKPSATEQSDNAKSVTPGTAAQTNGAAPKRAVPVASATASTPTPTPMAEPSKPKTWASLIATTSKPTKADVTPTKAPTPSSTQPKPNTATSHRPNSPVKQAEKAQEESNSEAVTEHKEDGFREVQGRQNKRAPQGQQQPRQDEEKYSIYIRGITEAVDRQGLHNTFSKVGTVQHVDHFPSKGIAFVQFTSVEHAQKAIGKSFTVNGVTVHAEERRKPRTFNQRQGGAQGGQYGPPRREFHDGAGRGRGEYHNRGMNGGRGGRGGYHGARADGHKAGSGAKAAASK